jgi:hypothetical protein
MSLSNEDSLELLQIAARADNCATTRDVDGYVALFAADGRMTGGMGSADGADAIRRMVTEVWGNEPRPTFHLTLNAVIGGTDEQPVIASALLLVSGGPPSEVIGVVHVTQTLRREHGGWRIVERHIEL